MSFEKKTAIISIIGIIVTGIIGTLTTYFAWKTYDLKREQLQLEIERTEQERDKARLQANTYRKLIEDAPSKFTNSLEKLIIEASREVYRKEGPSQLIPASKALVSARNGFRTSVESIGERLNSDIDQLERELRKETPDIAKIEELIEVLRRKWPAKKEEIELATRKVLTELGLTLQQ
jgi:F0F1-type ATP synthase membrane subunit b/b'